MSIKITPSDKWFSKCVRERNNWRCERCNGQPVDPRGLHCSHYKGRGNWAVRFEPLNAFAHCYGCHSYFEANPDEFKAWVEERLGPEKYEILMELAERDNGRGKLYHRAEKTRVLAQYYKGIYEKMLHLRSLGSQDRIEFEGYV